MPELESLKHITSTLFVARFPEDIDPGSALDPGNWSIIGNDSSPLPVDNVLPAYPPYSWRDFFVQTRKPTDQEYSLTVSGLTDPEGNPLDPFTHSWIPLQPPPEYPSDGIMNPSLDGRYYGSRAEIAIFRYPDWVTNVLGIDSDQNEYPFTQDSNDPRYWSFDTSQLPGPDEGFSVHPVPAEGHEEDFTEDELGILTIAILPSPFPPWMGEVMLSNQTRPGASVFYPTDTIVPTAFVHADQIRGAKLMIARMEDFIELLPYFPPGANDPNDPNYDPEAPEDGSGNPDWWNLPPRPDFPYYPWSPNAPPPWMPRPMSAAASPWEDQVMPAYPPDIGKDDMWQIEPPSFKPIDHDLGPGSYDLIVEVYDHENRKSDYILPFIIDYAAIIDWFRYYGEDITIRDVQDPNIIGWKLKHNGDEWDFTEDPENPGVWTIPSTVLPAPLPDAPRLPHIMPAYPPDFAGDMLPEVEIGVHALPERLSIFSFIAEPLEAGAYATANIQGKVKLTASLADLIPLQELMFDLVRTDAQGNPTETIPLAALSGFVDSKTTVTTTVDLNAFPQIAEDYYVFSLSGSRGDGSPFSSNLYAFAGSTEKKIVKDKLWTNWGIDYENRWNKAINDATYLHNKELERKGKNYSIDPAWIKAQMKVESHFDPKQTSPAGARGLMQIMPDKLGSEDDAYSEDETHNNKNIQAGIEAYSHAKERLKQWSDEREAEGKTGIAEDSLDKFAVGAYNGGTDRIINELEEQKDRPDFAGTWHDFVEHDDDKDIPDETREHVDKVSDAHDDIEENQKETE